MIDPVATESSDYPYAPDRFDREAETATFHGAHRAEVDFWRANLLYIVIIGAALLILLVTLLVAGALGSGKKAEDSVPPAPATTSASAPAKTTEAPEAKADKSVSVQVINASGKNGLAGAWKKTLKGDGWTSVQISTGKARQDKAVVYYRDEKDKATADALAKKVGADAAQQSNDYDSRITFLAVDQPQG